MTRQPTRAEIIETNANVYQQCDSCHIKVYMDKYYGTFPNMLTLRAEGGYGEYVDTIDPNSPEFEFHLCHKCGHKLMNKFFKQWDFSKWHPKTDDKFCDGWTPRNWTSEEEPCLTCNGEGCDK